MLPSIRSTFHRSNLHCLVRVSQSHRPRDLCRNFHSTPFRQSRNDEPVEQLHEVISIAEPITTGFVTGQSVSQVESKAAEGILTPVHDGLLWMHDVTGLSWGLTIPLATVCLRIFGVSWIQYWTNHESRKLAIVQPYLSAYSQEMGRRQHDVGEERFQIKSALALWRQNVLVRFGASPWRSALLPLLQLPIWWTFVETLRSMAGAPYGILGMMLHGLHLVDATSEGSIVGRSVLLPQLVESAMASEGMLWFTDLTISDPTSALSVILAAVTYANIHLSRGPVADPKYITFTRGRRQMQWIRKGMKLLPVALVPMTMYLPAATLLYWTSSAVSGLGVNLLLRKYRPIRKAVEPCTRGMDHLTPPPLWLNKLVKKHH